MAIFRNQQGD